MDKYQELAKTLSQQPTITPMCSRSIDRSIDREREREREGGGGGEGERGRESLVVFAALSADVEMWIKRRAV